VLRPQYGFWNLVGQQAPFESLTPVGGRWPKGRQEWLDRIRRKHREAMLKAEAMDVIRLADPTLDLDAEWRQVKTSLERPFAFNAETTIRGITKADVVALRDSAVAVRSGWQAVPNGGALVVSWPPTTAPEIVTADIGAEVRARG
jgi:hypothetical protein